MAITSRELLAWHRKVIEELDDQIREDRDSLISTIRDDNHPRSETIRVFADSIARHERAREYARAAVVTLMQIEQGETVVEWGGE